MLLKLSTIEIKYHRYIFRQFMGMYVYPKNHKSEVERELRMVPLREVPSATTISNAIKYVFEVIPGLTVL